MKYHRQGPKRGISKRIYSTEHTSHFFESISMEEQARTETTSEGFLVFRTADFVIHS